MRALLVLLFTVRPCEGSTDASRSQRLSTVANRGFNYSTSATWLNEHLLSGYNNFIPPPSSLRNETESHSLAGTDVRVNMRFYKVESVTTAEGRMAIQIWLRFRWRDERLAWDPAEFGGITRTFFMAVGLNKPEETEIWAPDVAVYNSVYNLNDIMHGQLAEVESDGTVTWSRPGLLDVLCRFSGLVAFPFDRLKCTIELGGWRMGAELQGLAFYTPSEGGSHSLAWNEVTGEKAVGAAYHEYWIQNVTALSADYFYGDHGSGDHYTVLRYTIHLGRVQAYYILLVIGPCILMSCFSFAVFWLKPSVGERLGYGITLILATEVFKLVVDEVVPVCGELLWIDLFTNVCSIFCFISLAESCVCLAVAFNTPSTGLNLLSYKELRALISTPAGWMYHKDEPALCAAAVILLERKKSAQAASRWVLTSSKSRPPLSRNAAAFLIVQTWREYSERKTKMKKLVLWSREQSHEMKRLLLFESYFYEVDTESDGVLTMDELRTFLSYAAMDLPIAERIEALRSVHENRGLGTVDSLDEWGHAGNMVMH